LQCLHCLPIHIADLVDRRLVAYIWSRQDRSRLKLVRQMDAAQGQFSMPSVTCPSKLQFFTDKAGTVDLANVVVDAKTVTNVRQRLTTPRDHGPKEGFSSAECLRKAPGRYIADDMAGF
jgi:hypothetical protein